MRKGSEEKESPSRGLEGKEGRPDPKRERTPKRKRPFLGD